MAEDAHAQPVIVYVCLNCGQAYDSPAICCINRDDAGFHAVPAPVAATREAFADPKAWPYDEGADRG